MKSKSIKVESKELSKTEKKKIQRELIRDPNWNNVEYKDLFPLARSLKRTIKFYVGPTNSGKTWNAINELVSCNSGVYLAPLRLLALEGQEEITNRGHNCSFLTGEEREILEDARFIAQTIETFDFTRKVGAVLIDEIQMLADPARGWAWTQAIVGAPSELIILTGNLESLDLVKFIVESLGDTLEVIELSRHTTLTPMPQIALENSILHLEEGTAIIAFSRKNVLHYKSLFEKDDVPVSIIYGNLSPEVRREEARKFREGETKFLISTDAIAMGLNLPIKRVIFSEVTKFNGKETGFLTSTEVKQIGGRAGRFGKYPEGFYTATSKADLAFLKKMMDESIDLPYLLYLKPSLLQSKQISEIFKTKSMTEILRNFKRITNNTKSSSYVSFDIDTVLKIAEITDLYELTLEEKLLFLEIPIDSNNTVSLSIFSNWIRAYKSNQTLGPEDYFGYNPHSNTEETLLAAENSVKMLAAYLWLSRKLPDFALNPELAKQLKDKHNEYIMKCLASKINSAKKCAECRVGLHSKSIHKLCQDCFEEKRSNRRDYMNQDFDFVDYKAPIKNQVKGQLKNNKNSKQQASKGFNKNQTNAKSKNNSMAPRIYSRPVYEESMYAIEDIEKVA